MGGGGKGQKMGGYGGVEMMVWLRSRLLVMVVLSRVVLHVDVAVVLRLQ